MYANALLRLSLGLACSDYPGWLIALIIGLLVGFALGMLANAILNYCCCCVPVAYLELLPCYKKCNICAIIQYLYSCFLNPHVLCLLALKEK